MDLLAHMATFVRIVEGKSLSAAARAQRLSLPAVSRQLSALEEELGRSLVVRSTRKLRITEAGLRLYEHALRVLREVEDARAAVSEPGGVAGRLVVSVSLSYGMLEVVPRVKRLSELHPRLEVDLRLEDQLVDLVGEGVDIAIRAGSAPPDSTAYVAHPLTEMQRVLVASPGYLRRQGALREPGELGARACLVQVTLAGQAVPWRVARAGSELLVPVHGALRASAPLALLELAVAGAGVAFLPDFVVARALAEGRLRRVLPEWSSPPLRAVAIHRAELRSAPRVRAFLGAFAHPAL